MTHFKLQKGENLRKQENVNRGKSLLHLCKGLYSASFLFCILLLVSCSNDKSNSNKDNAAKDTTSVGKDSITGTEDCINQLLIVYDNQDGKEQPSTANKIFDLLYSEELTDDRVTVTNSTPSDSIDMLVWYWAGE